MERVYPNADWGLAIESSGAWGSVALGRGFEIHGTRTLPAPRQYAAQFLPAVQALCAECSVLPTQIRYVFLSAGPGSFTGLRIGVTAARMLALAHTAGIVPVPTLDVIAHNALQSPSDVSAVAVVLDAGRARVYAAWYQRGADDMTPGSQPAEVDPYEFLLTLPEHVAVMGEGITYHRPAIERSGRRILPEALWPPRAETVYRLGLAHARKGRLVDRRQLIPVYVRPPEAEEKWAARTRPPSPQS